MDEIFLICHVIMYTNIVIFFLILQIYQADFTFTYFNIDDSRSAGGDENRPTIILGENVPIKYIVIHNSLPRYREEVVEFVVSKPIIIVENISGQPISAQVAPIWTWHRGGLGSFTPQASTTKFRLLFKAKVPPMGLKSYIIRSVNSISECKYVFV